MGRCLIVANQTLGGDRLDGAVRDCISRGVDQFFVVVPVTPLEHETPTWGGGFALGESVSSERMRAQMESMARKREAEVAAAEARAQDRLDQMIAKIEAAGGAATGELGGPDPVEATEAVLQRESFDEVIVSTLPQRVSRWLKMDLPNRVARMTDAPVTTVKAKGS